MKKNIINIILLTVLTVALSAAGVFAQSEKTALLTEVRTDDPIVRMVWNKTGDVLTLAGKNSVQRIAVSTPSSAEHYTLGEKSFFLTTLSETGVVAGLSQDWKTIYIYEPESPTKTIREIEPGFVVLSVSVSKDGSRVLADSAEQIRTVIYDASDGSIAHDLSGFETAAPVYDSTLSPDGTSLLWHSRGTFAVQNIADGSFGEKISLWDFASSFELSPDNSLLAVGIINDDYESGAVIFFDPLSGKEQGRTILGKTAPHEISFSDDGSTLWAADADTVYQIDPKTFELQQKIPAGFSNDENRITRIAASPDGKSAAVLLNNGYLLIAE